MPMVEPSISMETPFHVPKKAAPSSPMGWAGSGVGSGVGSGIGSLLTAASSASTSGICAGSVMHCSRENAALPSSFRKAEAPMFSTYLPR